MTDPVLDVEALDVTLFTRGGALPAVQGFSITVGAGETVALVGESGCGKTLTALAIMRLLPDPPARITGGHVRLSGKNLLDLPEREMVRLRGRDMAMIFQDPMSALNPVLPIGTQLAEVLHAHTDLRSRAVHDRSRKLLEMVGVPDAAGRLADYPHQLSGGTCQRVMIAMAVACRPRLLIADEATTALDVTIQAQVLALLTDIQREVGMGMLYITHDLAVVAEIAQRVVVMYAGEKVEEASAEALFAEPLHPYTRGLLAATPVPGAPLRATLAEIPGRVPPLSERPAGCLFAARCPLAFDRCRAERPALHAAGADRQVACFAVPPQ
jgi:oligopeptide/dipeptide ABC transporter ATP-binding protein